MQDARVSRIVKYLKDTYTFNYAFSNEELKKYGFENWNIKSDWIQNPLFFSPNVKKNCLTVMAFGGCIGWIPLDEEKNFFSKQENKSIKDFARYLSPLEDGNELFYKNGHGHVFYLPDRFVEKYSRDGFAKIKKLLEERKNTIEQLLTNVDFVDMLVCAAYVCYMHRPQGVMVDVSERSMETILGRRAWENYEKKNMVVIDIEYKPELTYKAPSIDFLVFDKERKSFGLVEFKYQGMSMNEKDDNDLSVHFRDFIKIILDEDVKRRILGDIVDNFSLLIDTGVLAGKELSDLLGEINKKIENDDIRNCLWCGFYFLDEKRMISKRKEIKVNVPLIERIEYDCKRQIIFNPKFVDIIKNKEIDVRYQHSYLEEEIEIRMDEDMIEKFSEGA